MSLAPTPTFSSEERIIIAKYRMEMQIDDLHDYDDDTFELEQILIRFDTSSHRNIVLLEPMALVYADGGLPSRSRW